jgi:cyclohexanone monooxygenase
MATGCLSVPKDVDIEGAERFAGPRYWTSRWPHEGVDFTGMRVAVIGTGSSAIQSVPLIAEQATHLYVFQRTPHYTVPAHNAPLTPEYRTAVKAHYPQMRARAWQMPNGLDFDLNPGLAVEATPEERRREYERRWAYGGVTFMGAYSDLLATKDANDTAAEFVRSKIRETVRDSELAERLSPRYVIGCKRLCVDTGYWETFNRENVTLVDLRDTPIAGITRRGIQVGSREYAVDAIVFATGFDAMTGALLRIDIRGAGGARLKDKWREGPKSYLGLAVAGFPNLFTINGPGSPSVLTNMLPSIEQHVEWIAQCLAYLRSRDLRRIEARADDEERWVAHVADAAGTSLRSTCSSWYVGANIPGKTRVFMPYIGGVPAYVRKCAEVAANGYLGFALR